MNILIVGNGFDLSHYLPTKYDHFMDVMKAIEGKDLGQPIKEVFKDSVEDLPTLLLKTLQIKNALNEQNYEMNFDELFSKCREKWFIEKTQSMYSTDSINLNLEKIIEIQYQLKNNGWYQYFKCHLKEIDTWIDFEQKIEEALKIFSKCIPEIENIENLDEIFSYINGVHSNKLNIKNSELNFFNNFKFSVDQKVINKFTPLSGIEQTSESTRKNINPIFCYRNERTNGINPNSIINFIHKQLEEFIEIFNIYLELIVSQLSPIRNFSIDSKDWLYPDKIYSFNYTNTYQRIHDSVEVEYLHGSHGEHQNIVLGVSDLEDESLKKIKAYGFTKYHQKLFKDTSYLFLDNYKNTIKENKIRLKNYYKNFNDTSLIKGLRIVDIIQDEIFNLNLYIWGHSLDVSDKDYIIDLFSLNDGMDRNVRVIVYHFNKTAKFDLLNNLLAILGKDKVEHWMKNRWLQFEENPKIVLENAITSEGLSKV